jgi:hypothetical protein
VSAERNDFSFAVIENLRRGTADLKRVLAQLNGLAPRAVPASREEGQALESEQSASAKRDDWLEARGCGGQRGAGKGRG